MGRKQYKYHTLWNEKRNETKFHRLHDFGKTLPVLRKKVQRDISKSSLCKEKVLATIVSLMERTYIRVGNCEYEKLYGSYGLTTLKDNHVKINGSSIKFSFNGKKGIHHTVTLKNQRLAKIVRSCRDIPGKELFQYINEKGDHAVIDSGMVNDYIKETSDIDFTAKDALKSRTATSADGDIKHNVLSALDEVSLKLGNTRSVCRKYYVHPQIIKLYEDGGLQPYLRQLEDIETNSIHTKLTPNEKVLMKILRKFG
jgi:DNA topoisomerase-1